MQLQQCYKSGPISIAAPEQDSRCLACFPTAALSMAVWNGSARRRWSKLREWLLPAADGQRAEQWTTLARAAGNV